MSDHLAEVGRVQVGKFSLVRRTDTGVMGRVIREDHYGVFGEWDGAGIAYVRPWLVEKVEGVASRYVADLVALIRWLHPDDWVDPCSYEAIRRDCGSRAAVLLQDIALSRLTASECAKSDANDSSPSRPIGAKETRS